jgi:hypothetical protein
MANHNSWSLHARAAIFRRQETSRRDRQEDGFLGRARGPPVTLYLDTSSAIKLYVLEDGADVVHALVGDAAVVATSAITYAEMRARLARLRREGALTVQKYETRFSSFDDRLNQAAQRLARRLERQS